MHVDDLFGGKNRTIKGSLFGNEEEIKGCWQGEIDKRSSFVLTMTAAIPLFEGYSVAIYKFVDEDGNQFVWFASKESNIEVGLTYEVRATVKQHKVYEGVRQTVINRVTVKKTQLTADDVVNYDKTKSAADLWDIF